MVEAVDDDGSVDVVADWFSEAVEAGNELPEFSVGENEGSDEEEELAGGERGGVIVEDLCDVSGEAFVVAEAVQPTGVADLYDSGCTNHISPYRNQFENFQSITPCHFCAANKQTFSTTGRGELVIDVPHGEVFTVPHIVRPDSGGLWRSPDRTVVRKIVKFYS